MTDRAGDEEEYGAAPYSAWAIRRYRAGLKSLSDDCERYHRDLLGEIEKHEEKLDSPALQKHFRSWRRDHEVALDRMLFKHRKILADAQRQLHKQHPDLEPDGELSEHEAKTILAEIKDIRRI